MATKIQLNISLDDNFYTLNHQNDFAHLLQKNIEAF